MSKSNDISNMATLDDHRPLADSELVAVSGGWLPSGIPGAEMYIPRSPTDPLINTVSSRN